VLPIREEDQVAEFMDVHREMKGITPELLLEAHNADLAIQDEERVNFKHAWADPEAGMVFCLSEAPNADAVKRIHERAGHPTDEVYEVPVQA
jgi:Nickel responsive protein SCO4226-like